MFGSQGSPKYYSYDPYTEGATRFTRSHSLWTEDAAMTSDLGAPAVEERLSGYDYKTAMSVSNFEERIDICPMIREPITIWVGGGA